MILVYHCVFKVLIVVDDSVFCLSIFFLFFTVIRDSETHNDMNNNQKKNEW